MKKNIRLGRLIDRQKSFQCQFWETSFIIQSVFSSVLSPSTILCQSIHFFLLPLKESYQSLLLRTVTNWEQKRIVKMPFTKLQRLLAVHPVTLYLWLTTVKTTAIAIQKQSEWSSIFYTTRCWRWDCIEDHETETEKRRRGWRWSTNLYFLHTICKIVLARKVTLTTIETGQAQINNNYSPW